MGHKYHLRLVPYGGIMLTKITPRNSKLLATDKPFDNFIWPEVITVSQKGSYGRFEYYNGDTFFYGNCFPHGSW
jgi:hypothetical protein